MQSDRAGEEAWRLRRFAIVKLEQSTETFTAQHFSLGSIILKVGFDDLVVESLMVSFSPVMANVVSNGSMKRGFAQEDQPVQTFGFNAAHESLGVGVQIRRTRWETKTLNARRPKQSAEVFAVKAGAVVNEVTAAFEKAVKPVG